MCTSERNRFKLLDNVASASIEPPLECDIRQGNDQRRDSSDEEEHDGQSIRTANLEDVNDEDVDEHWAKGQYRVRFQILTADIDNWIATKDQKNYYFAIIFLDFVLQITVVDIRPQRPYPKWSMGMQLRIHLV